MAAEISTITAILEDAREDLPGPFQVQSLARREASAPAPLPASPPQNQEKQENDLSNAGRLIFFALAALTLMVALDGTSISVALPVHT
ncbi:hypothetical protein BJX62DRAFT_236370 [Aspergillus germanicus]